MRIRTLSPFLTTRGAVPGYALAFMVSRLKSVISLGSGRRCRDKPPLVEQQREIPVHLRSLLHAVAVQLARTRVDDEQPGHPQAIWVISSWWAWYMPVLA